ncbi:mucin-2-like [Labeo rohita]|uniref:mucin-2-like n=1 Tax=Labeo rohita TaxID=84645 RepID=UPI0021E23A68|nr:mucin-2-like [Labeo rohita]
MGTVRMSQMWMLRWVILLVGLHSIHADIMHGYKFMSNVDTIWPTTTAQTVSVLASNHVNNICSMWGNFHFKTFDGDFYQFPGMCEYKLVYDYNEFSPLFSVHVKRMERTKKSEIPKISRVRVTINSFEFTLTKSQVMVNGKNASLPVYESGILVEKNTIYIRLYYKMGITVMWNKEDAVMVELDSKYSNSTQGLCGDFNGIRNEFERNVGYNEFGNRHKVSNLKDFCEDPFEGNNKKNLSDQCNSYRSECENLLKNEDWSSCIMVLNPGPYIEACMKDMCPNPPKDTNKSTICATLSEYSRQCSHAGGTPPTWRRADFCAVTCPYNMVHSENGSPCIDTCSHKDTDILCEQHNIDGCFCPSGTVLDEISNRGCIPVQKCQCKHDRSYSPGEVLLKYNEKCICKEGNWICRSIPSPGLCSVEEGSHFTTFDGKEFTFHGACNYVLSKDCEESKFSIFGHIVPCFTKDADTCLKSIGIWFDNNKNHPLIIKADGTVQHDTKVSLPYNTADFTVFMPSSFHIMLQTTFGLQVQVQLVPLMQVYITVDKRFQGKTCGICGNFNKVVLDDLMTPQGVVEGTPVSFANAWKAQSNCPDRTERMVEPCSYRSDSERFATEWCSKMINKESLFANCHAVVNPDSYYKRCKYSTCTCEKSEECMCAVFSSYVRACAAKRIILQGWREIVCKKYTENCPTSQNYSYALKSCQRTCLSLASKQQSCRVDFLPVDGCTCPDGLYQNKNGLCVPMEKCPCYHDEQEIHPGKSITIGEEHWVCVNGKLQCVSEKLPIYGCPSPKVFFNCSTAARGELGLSCAKTCLQQNVDCFSLDCLSGCQCPSGLLDDGRGYCVKQENCPCKHDGQFYAPGSEITIDCNKCTCRKGNWNCTDKKCPGLCTIYGNGHYVTFDQQIFSFKGDCSYIAVQNKCGNKTGNFHVITENMPCETTGTTCSKSVRILLGGTQLLLFDGTLTASSNESGQEISYTVRNIGMYVVIDADIGLTIMWNRKTTVYIILQPQHMGDVCGLCGNFNENGKDDLTTQGNLMTTDIKEFVNSWTVLNKCLDKNTYFYPCMNTQNDRLKFKCNIIKGVKFQNCHNKVDPTPYFDSCVGDLFTCDPDGNCECYCTAVAAYAQACNKAGICVDWRTPDICPVYCEYYNKRRDDCTWHYSPCKTPCYKTCLYPDGICNNTLPNLEGCYPKCPKDTFFHEETQTCVVSCVQPTTTTTESTTLPTPSTTTMPTTTTESTTSPTPSTTTIINYHITTTTESTTSRTPSTTTMPTTTTESTTSGTQSTTTMPTTTTESTTSGTQSTTTMPTTTTESTTSGTQSTTTMPTTTTESTTSGTQSTTTMPTTTTESTTSGTQSTTTMPTTTTESTTSGTQSTTTTPTTTTESTTSGTQSTTTTPTTTTESTTSGTQSTTTTPTTTTESTTSGTQSTTTTPTTTTESTTSRTTSTTTTTTTTTVSTTSQIIPTTEGVTNVTGVPQNVTLPPDRCPKWNKNTNETFMFCNCTMARCIKDNIIEIIPFQCPPLQNITCENGKKPVLVYDKHQCCQYYTCDCFCEGWGQSRYITFDGHFYSHQGNCTYILMEEIQPQYHLKIYINSVYCDPDEHVSCPRSVIVSYNKLVITLTNHNLIGDGDLEAVMDNVKLKLPYDDKVVTVISSGLDLILSIPKLNVKITFGATSFGVNLPFQHFGNNTQGHCGTCNNNKADDCMIPGGILVNDCAVMADYWPSSDVNGSLCTPPTALPTAGVDIKLTPKPCEAHSYCNLLNSELFKECHPHLSPKNYFLACKYDSCHISNPAMVCTSLQSYARACSQVGVCIHWRNYTNLCNIECSADKVFNPCGPAEPPTCAVPDRNTSTVPTEGCFCLEGTLLFNKESGVCVNKCGCLDASGMPRKFGEVFEHHCEECTCNKARKSVICKPKNCPHVSPVICTDPSFVLVNVTNPSDPCCSKQVCNCNISMCPPLDKKCAVGYAPVLKVPEGKCCPEIKCEPKKVCVHSNIEYEPGTVIPFADCQECNCTWDVDPTTQFFKTECQFVQCNQKCDPGYNYMKNNFDKCCGKCVQTQCIVSINGIDRTLKEGETLPSSNQGCDKITCTKVNGQFITNKHTVQCPPFNISNCQPGTVQLSSDGCCRVCVDQDKGCKIQTVLEFIKHNDCHSVEKLNLTFCSGDCTSSSWYIKPGMSSCTCCQATRSSNRTVNLDCGNRGIVTHTYIHVEECACREPNCHEMQANHTLADSQRRTEHP